MTREQIISSLRYFSPLNDPKIDWDRVDLDALVCLDNGRHMAKTAIVVTSNYRSPEHSEAVGGIKNDAHTEIPCTAFDILCARPNGKWDSQKAFILIPALIKAGFNRIGAGKGHIHVDRSVKLPADVFWLE